MQYSFSWALTRISKLNYISEFPVTFVVNHQKKKKKINGYTAYIKEKCINDIKKLNF